MRYNANKGKNAKVKCEITRIKSGEQRENQMRNNANKCEITQLNAK